MTDEKKELPWPRHAYEVKFTLTRLTSLKPCEPWYVVPEPEAIRLHTLDERVKKFEEATESLLTHHKHFGITLEIPEASSLYSLMDSIALLREAMGDK